MTALGTGEYEAFVTDNRAGDAVVAELTPFLIRGQWNRFLDEPSTAQVTVGLSPECCDVLCKFGVIRHDLAIVRNGETVWQGPIVRREYAREGNVMRISARDVVWWLQVRVLPRDYDFTGNLGTYIQTVIEEAMAPDERGLLPHLLILPGITSGTRRQDAFSQYAYDELRELARTVVDYTTIGKRLIIGPDLYPLAEVDALGDEDFLEGIQTMEDGLDFRSETFARGQNIITREGGINDYYGLVQGILREFSIKDEGSLQVAAEIDNEQADYPPTLLFGEGGARMAPTAPVEQRDLIPGVITTISLGSVCPPVTQQQRLLRVEVNFSSAPGEPDEFFGTRWGPIGATVNRRQDV